MRCTIDQGMTELTLSMTAIARAVEDLSRSGKDSARDLERGLDELRRMAVEHHSKMLEAINETRLALAEIREGIKSAPLHVAEKVGNELDRLQDRVDEVSQQFMLPRGLPPMGSDDQEEKSHPGRRRTGRNKATDFGGGDGEGKDDEDDKGEDRKDGKDDSGPQGITASKDHVHVKLTKEQIRAVWAWAKWVVITIATGGGVAALVKGSTLLGK